jgi:hypothetical protein
LKTISLHPATPSQRRLTAWAGMLAPLLFVLVFTLEGSLRPGYSPLSTYVSALSLGPRGWIQIANFLLFGALLFGFTRGLAAEFPTGKASRWGLILMTVIAGLYFISGPFVMDPMNTPVDQATWHGIIHGLAGGIAFILMPISCFIYLRRFRADPNWNFLSGWTLALGTLVAVVVVAFSIISKSTELSLQFKDHLGLIQRGLIIPYMFWLFLFAFGLLRRSQ